MATYGKKFAGGKFQLKYAEKLLDQGKVLKFEVSNLSNNLTRIYDIQIEFFEEGQRFIKNLELKNWENSTLRLSKINLSKTYKK